MNSPRANIPDDEKSVPNTSLPLCTGSPPSPEIHASPSIFVSAFSTAQSPSACSVSLSSSAPLSSVAPPLSCISSSFPLNTLPNKNNSSFTTISFCPSSSTVCSSSPPCPFSSTSCSSSSATDSTYSPLIVSLSSSCSCNSTICSSTPVTFPSVATCISSASTCPPGPTSCSCFSTSLSYTSSSPCIISPTSCSTMSVSCTSSSATNPSSTTLQSPATNCSVSSSASGAVSPTTCTIGSPSSTTTLAPSPSETSTTSSSMVTDTMSKSKEEDAVSPTTCQPPSANGPPVSTIYPSTKPSTTSPITPPGTTSPVSSTTCTTTSPVPSTVCPPSSTADSPSCTVGSPSSTTTSAPSPSETSTTSSPLVTDTMSKSKEEDEFSSELEDILSKLREMASWSNAEATKLVKSVDGLFWKHKDHQKELGDVFCELQGADLLVTMLLSLNKEGVFSKNPVWQTAFYIYNTAWNLSDSSLNLALRLGQLEMIRICATNISHKPYLNNMSQKNVLFLIKASLNILHNLAKCPSNRHYYRTENVVEKLETFMEGEPYLKAISMMTLAYIVEEGQESMLDKEGHGTIDYLVRVLMDAQNSEDKRSQGLSDKELTAALGRLAVHDNNKVKISDAGGIPLIFSMLGDDCRETQAAAANAIWNLTFSDKVCQDIKGHSEWLDALKSLSNSDHTEVAKAAVGALWKINKDKTSPVIKEDDRESHVSLSSSISSLRSLQKKSPHIMLSYQWNAQPVALKIRDALLRAGYRIWVDVDCMYGSTLQAMAEAVENACAIIMCMSESYKESPNCRTEAEYAFQLQKRIIPVKIEEHYRPDGWLGIILGAKFYMDFSGRLEIEQEMRKLIKEVEMHGIEAKIVHSEDTDDGEVIGTMITFPLESAGISSRIESLDWSSSQVQDWLSENELEYLRPSLAEYNGRLLHQLYKMRGEAPEFFYASIKEDFGLKRLIDVLKFIDALDVLLKDS